MLDAYKACINTTDDEFCRNFSGGAAVMTTGILRDLVITAFVFAVLESLAGSYLTYCENSVEKEVGAKMKAPHPFESKASKEARMQKFISLSEADKLRHLRKLQTASGIKGTIPAANFCFMLVLWYHGGFEGTDETTFLFRLFSSILSCFRFFFKYGDDSNNKENAGANRFGNMQRNPVAAA